jgi:nitroreductase
MFEDIIAVREQIMIGRREFLALGGGLMAGGLVSPSRTLAAGATSYDEAVRSTWAPLRVDGGVRELIRYATLAANSHNTQPWKFTAKERNVTIAPDFARRCPAVDPQDHHLFVSLGCATENFVHAAAAAGFRSEISTGPNIIKIALDPDRPMESELFRAIPRRQSTRAEYDGTAVPSEHLAALEKAATRDGVEMILITDRTRINTVIDYVTAANSAQMRDKAFMNELKQWIRFNDADAVATMDGLSARTTANPQLPAWLARLLLPLVLTERGENERYRTQIQSSAGIAVLVAERNQKADWVEVGRACQRFALQATALGLKQAFINQPVEVPHVRRQFAAFLGIGDRLPDLVMRFGSGPELPKSLRRPVDQVMT